MQPTIYCFSGLGADEQLFEHLKVDGYNLQHIQWLPPGPQETLPHYAARLAQQVTGPQPVLLGVSFGGMLALEAAAIVRAQQSILISSIQSAAHFPFYYQWANRLRLTDWLPTRLLVTPNPIADYLFGVENSEDKKLLHDYMRRSDPAYIRWALWAIINWKNKSLPQNLTHIHGTRDRIIPLPKNVHHTIEGGGHLMIYNRAHTINALLNKWLLPAD